MREVRIIPTALLIAAGEATEALIQRRGVDVLGGVFWERSFELLGYETVGRMRYRLTVTGELVNLPDGGIDVTYSESREVDGPAEPRRERPHLRLVRSPADEPLPRRRRRSPVRA